MTWTKKQRGGLEASFSWLQDSPEIILHLSCLFPEAATLGTVRWDLILMLWSSFGLKVNYENNGLRVHRSHVSEPETIVTLLESGDTVTENAILTAVATKRDCVQICNASCNYMVQDLCMFLQQIGGVSIEGTGSPVLTIRCHEREGPRPVTYPILEDPIEAFFFIAAAIVTRSNLRVQRVPTAFIALELRLLQKMGLRTRRGRQYSSASGVTALCDLDVLAQDSSLKALEQKIHPNVYPFGVNVDNLPAFGPIAAVLEGTTVLHDWMYEQRATYFTLLKDFGVEVDLLDAHRTCITGLSDLRSTNCRLPPALRPASMVLLAALAAPGVSCLYDVGVLDRGYEDLAGRLRSLGACVFDGQKTVTDRQVTLSEGAMRSVM